MSGVWVKRLIMVGSRLVHRVVPFFFHLQRYCLIPPHAIHPAYLCIMGTWTLKSDKIWPPKTTKQSNMQVFCHNGVQVVAKWSYKGPGLACTCILFREHAQFEKKIQSALMLPPHCYCPQKGLTSDWYISFYLLWYLLL